MTYRLFVTLLLCFMVSACAGIPPVPQEKPLSLPERFVGTWSDYTGYDAFYVLMPDGIIEVRHKDTKELIEVIKYKVIYVENPQSVYILTLDNLDTPEHSNYQYQHIYLESAPIPSIKWTYSCFTNKADWQKDRSEQEKRILEHDRYECDVTKHWRGTWYYKPYRY